MENKTIFCGFKDGEFWVAQYNEFSLDTLAIVSAYNDFGDFSKEMQSLLEEYNISPSNYFGTPLQVLVEIRRDKIIKDYLNSETGQAILDLMKAK